MRAYVLLALAMLAWGCSDTADGAKGNGDGGGGGAATGTGRTTAVSSSTGSGVNCAAPESPAVFETGTGETCFERVIDQETVTVFQGPQGGYHLFAAIGCADCGTSANVIFGIKDPSTSDWYASTFPQQAILDLSPGAWPQKAGLTAFLPGLIYEPDQVLPKGTHVVLAASIVDAGGATLHEQEIEVILGDTMIWDPPCDDNPDTCGKPGGFPCCGLDGG